MALLVEALHHKLESHRFDFGIFYWLNPSSCTMAQGSTQPLTEMNTRNISWGVKAAGVLADNLTNITCQLSQNMGASTSWNPLGL